MADLTAAVEIAAKGWHDDNRQTLIDYFGEQGAITWEETDHEWKESVRNMARPYVSALANAGLLKENNG